MNFENRSLFVAVIIQTRGCSFLAHPVRKTGQRGGGRGARDGGKEGRREGGGQR